MERANTAEPATSHHRNATPYRHGRLVDTDVLNGGSKNVRTAPLKSNIEGDRYKTTHCEHSRPFVWMMVNVAIYARVSTDKQTTDPQKDELRAEALRRGWTVVAEIEDVISGAKFTRTGLDHLMALVRRHSIKAVLCYKLDRLGRSLPHLAQMIAEFDAHGVALVCTNQGIDTSNTNPAGRLVMHVLMAIAEFERSLTIDRTKIGMRAARARGKHIGRKPAPMPANAVAILAEWRAAGGANYRALATKLGVNVGTAYRFANRNVECETAT